MDHPNYLNPPLHEVIASFRFGPGKGREGITSREIEQRLTMANPRIHVGVVALDDKLAIRVSRPYPGWPIFRSLVLAALVPYRDVAEPPGVIGVGVRFINRIPFPSDGADLGRYFTRIPEYPEGVGISHMVGFFSRIQCELPSEPARVTITLADLEAKPAILLDIDASWMTDEDPLPLDRAIERMDNLKAHARGIFEQSITAELRETFVGERLQESQR